MSQSLLASRYISYKKNLFSDPMTLVISFYGHFTCQYITQIHCTLHMYLIICTYFIQPVTTLILGAFSCRFWLLIDWRFSWGLVTYRPMRSKRLNKSLNTIIELRCPFKQIIVGSYNDSFVMLMPRTSKGDPRIDIYCLSLRTDNVILHDQM